MLIYPIMGDHYALIQERGELLQRAIPSVRIVYDKLLSLATHSDLLNEQYTYQVEKGDPIKLSLNTDNKKTFLHAMYQRIEDLKQKIQHMQYKLAIHSEMFSLLFFFLRVLI